MAFLKAFSLIVLVFLGCTINNSQQFRSKFFFYLIFWFIYSLLILNFKYFLVKRQNPNAYQSGNLPSQGYIQMNGNQNQYVPPSSNSNSNSNQQNQYQPNPGMLSCLKIWF